MENIDNYILDEETLAEHYKESGNTYGYESKSKLVEYLKELKAYKDAEEQGFLLRLQVAIGNIVYRINEYADEPLIPMVVTSIEIKGITNTFKEMKCNESMTMETPCKKEICCLECEKVNDCKNVCSYVEFDKFTKENVDKCIFSIEED